MPRRGKRTKTDSATTIPAAPFPPISIVAPRTLAPQRTLISTTHSETTNTADLTTVPTGDMDNKSHNAPHGEAAYNKKSRPNGSTPTKETTSNLSQHNNLAIADAKDNYSMVRNLDESMKAAKQTQIIINSAPTDTRTTGNKPHEIPGTAIQKMGPQGSCSWNLGQPCCTHPSLLLDFCKEPNCTTPVHNLCQVEWETSPLGEELGAGTLRCPEHHEHFNSKLPARPIPKPSSLTSAMNKTPKGKDKTWTPTTSTSKQISFSNKITVVTEPKQSSATIGKKQATHNSATVHAPLGNTGQQQPVSPYNHKYKFAVKINFASSSVQSFFIQDSQLTCIRTGSITEDRPNCCIPQEERQNCSSKEPTGNAC